MTAASIAADLRELSIDPAQTYRVRDLQLVRGDIKIYLTEGILSFAKPVAGRQIAAVFTVADTEGGDAEVLLLPPGRSERSSLAGFTKTPNLDEHFQSAVFFFSDETAKDMLDQIHERPVRAAPEEAAGLGAVADAILRSGGGEIDVRLTQSLLDSHPLAEGYLYGIIGGRTLGTFDVIYEPSRFESVTAGRIAQADSGGQRFEIWTSFRPRRAPPFVESTRDIRDYRLDAVIHANLSMSAEARFQYVPLPADGRVIPLEMASRLRAVSATVDGKPAEVFQHSFGAGARLRGSGTFLLIAAEPLSAGTPHEVEVHYEGSLVRQTSSGSYFVDDRSTWYPFLSPMLASFDLTFHCPENIRVVSTGELVSEEVSAGIRTVHRKTSIPEPLAGFNLGNYDVSGGSQGRYRIELFSDKTSAIPAALPAQAASVLDFYSDRWQPLPIHSLAISPIEGYFGQGFPGLIYLSNISYIREQDRPTSLRNPKLDSFFSEMLLPHEIAHQWWGSVVSHADYRAVWLMEAMSNYAALEYLEHTKGRAAVDAVLERYRDDLSAPQKEGQGESAGPVDFGERILDNSGTASWHLVLYEKGSWILHMLRLRLGDDGFHALESRILRDYSGKSIGNEEFRKLAQELVPAGQPDKPLTLFFENWIYGTGIPRMSLRSTGPSLSLKLSGVDEGFSIDVPLRCSTPGGTVRTEWVRAGAGDNSLDLPAGSRSCELPKTADYLYLPEK